MADPDRRSAAIHLFALSGLMVAQPLYDILGRSPEFFWTRRSGLGDVIGVACVLSIGIPAVLYLVQRVAARLGADLMPVWVASLSALGALPPLVRLGSLSAWVVLPFAACWGVACGWCYVRWSNVRRFVSVLGIAALVAPIAFIARFPLPTHPAEIVAESSAGAGPPIVMIVFDEFPSRSLVDSTGRIDGSRFPNFARLLEDATWFRNATTVATMTSLALPAILTGRTVHPGEELDASLHTKNLFTLLSPTHELHVTEGTLRFCPNTLCGEGQREPARTRVPTLLRDLWISALMVGLPLEFRHRIPQLSDPMLTLGDDTLQADRSEQFLGRLEAQREFVTDLGQRKRVFESFLAGIEPGERPALHYLHSMLPHAPSVYLPSGAVCPARTRLRLSWPNWEVARIERDRHLLQVGFVDRLLGALIDRLEELDLYDDTLLIITSDHGQAFQANSTRRALTDETACHLIPVPLFVKLPGQKAGGISDLNVRTLDILPTIAESVGFEIPWAVEGQPVFGGMSAEDKQVVGPSAPGETPASYPDGGRRIFPADFATRCLTSPLTPQLGKRRPNTALLGRRVDDLEIAEGPDVDLIIEPSALEPVLDPAAGVVPCRLSGIVVPTESRPRYQIAVSVNGRIEGVSWSGPLRPLGAGFDLNLPEAAFQPGPNEIRVFLVEEHDGHRRLRGTRISP